MKNNPALNQPDAVPVDWVSSRKSSPEKVRLARSQGLDTDDVSTDPVVQIIDRMKPGDELRSFSSLTKSFRSKVGRKGYVVMRDGKIVHAALTAMN